LIDISAIAIALAFYLASQLLRAARIAMLCLDDRTMMRRLVAVHLVTLMPGAILPLKSGELLRAAGFVLMAPNRVAGALVWIIERTADSITLAILLVVLTALGPAEPEMRLLIITLFLFAFSVLGSGLAIREIVPFLHDDLLLRSRSPNGLKALRLVIASRSLVASAQTMLKGRVSLLVLLSVMIWILELACVAVLLDSTSLTREIGDAFSQALISGYESDQKRLLILGFLTGVGVILSLVLVIMKRRTHDASK
jgi:hypothetical protein